MKDYKFNLLGQNLFLHPLKAVFWEDKKTLLIADVHLGKAAHFRKSGIPVSDEIHQSDLIRIRLLLDHYSPARFIILGDLFHSSYNKTWDRMRDFFNEATHTVPELVLGNHDVLEAADYSFLQLHTVPLAIPPFILTHEPLPANHPTELYNLCGHIHPGITLRGRARQSVKAPCFYFGERVGILPAFGNFTGMAKATAISGSTSHIFAISSDSVIPLQ